MKNWDFKWQKCDKEAETLQEQRIVLFLEKLDDLPLSIALGVLMSVLTTYIENEIELEKHRNETYETIIKLLASRAEWQAKDPRFTHAPHC